MEAHYAKLSILAIVTLIALMNVPGLTGNATYSVEDEEMHKRVSSEI